MSAMLAVIGRIDPSSTKIRMAKGGIYQDIQEIVLMTNLTPSECFGFKPPFQALIGEGRSNPLIVTEARCGTPLRNLGLPCAKAVPNIESGR
jgi:hypothetical protein